MKRRRLANWILRGGLIVAMIGGGIQITAWAENRDHMKCYDVTIPSFSHPCKCFGDPATMPSNDPHWSDVCEKAIPTGTNTGAVWPICVDMYPYTCLETSGVYSCGNVYNCLGKKCDTDQVLAADCILTNKGSCNKTFGNCTSGS